MPLLLEADAAYDGWLAALVGILLLGTAQRFFRVVQLLHQVVDAILYLLQLLRPAPGLRGWWS